jgi:UDP-glucose 4-epimerase
LNVLVTGGAGFIGSHIARRLLDDGHRVFVVDNLSTGYARNVPHGAELIELDISLPGLAERLPSDRFDGVLHLAAQSSGEISHERPETDILTNVFGTIQLLQWAHERGARRFLYGSSMAVYGLTEELPVREDVRFVPHSFYGINKLASEHYLSHFQRLGLSTTAFRMFNVYGPGQNLANMKQGMVSIYLAYLLDHEKLLVRGSPERFRDFIYVGDVVDAWVTALFAPEADGRVYNVGSGRPTLVRELIAGLMAAFGYDGAGYPVEYGDPTPGDQFGIYADITRIRSELGWEPRVELAGGLRLMVDWARTSTATGRAGS